jgi:rsbT co-antagonist protein RsbR
MLNSIHDVAVHLAEHNEKIARQIIEDIIQSLQITPSQEEVNEAVVNFKEFINFLREALINDEETITRNLIEWSRQNGERDAVMGKKITEAVELYPVIRKTFIEHLYKISNQYQLPMDEVISINIKLNYTLDLAINETIKAYDQFKEKIIKATQEEMNELSSPLVPVDVDIAVLPLIGSIDSYRARQILERVVPKAAELKLTYLIIDFSGLQALDTMVTEYIFKIHDVLRLLGITAIATGIRPEIAQTAVQIGVDLSSITSYATVKQALQIIQAQRAAQL